MRAKRFRKLVQEPAPNFGVGHFSSPEQDCNFYFIARIEELGGSAALRFEIVIVNLWPDANFLELDRRLMLAGFTLLAALLISKLAVIHEPADGWNGVWCYLDEIKSSLSCHFQRIARGNDSYLFAVLIDEPDFANANPFVDPRLNWSGYSGLLRVFFRLSLL